MGQTAKVAAPFLLALPGAAVIAPPAVLFGLAAAAGYGAFVYGKEAYNKYGGDEMVGKIGRVG